MKKFLFLLCITTPVFLSAQLFVRKNISLISLIDPSPVGGGNSSVGNRYSGCWGWYQADKNREYAISGTSNGTYFIDVTNPTTPVVCDYVDGKHDCIWREMKTYKNYCYIISDDPSPNKFQIVDMQYLPDSVHVIHEGTQYFERGHTIWIDNDKMYIGLTWFGTAGGFSPMSIFSLATPTAPAFLKRVETDIPDAIIHEVHDMYARNDTVYASAGWKGLVFLRYNAGTNSLTVLGTYKDYPNAGYNHSSSMTKNGQYMMFCDEVPGELPIHFIDISNLNNAQPMASFHPYLKTTGHNPYIVNNSHAVVSAYKDGLFIFDISQPTNLRVSGYFDTYPQGGDNTGDYGGGAYGGNWGAYPWLPSGIIIANDMQNGVFLLNPNQAYTTTPTQLINPVGIDKNNSTESNFIVYPNPASSRIAVHYNNNVAGTLVLRNILGEVVLAKEFENGFDDLIDISSYGAGTYILSINTGDRTLNKKLVITK